MKKYNSKMQKGMFTLKDKVCIITGGAGLIGESFVEVCSSYGAKVVIADINKNKSEAIIKRIKKEIDCDVYFFRCNTNSEKDVRELVKFTVSKFGKIDALVNCAYPRNKNFGRSFEDVTHADFCDNLGKNLGGYFLVSKAVSLQMIKQKSGNIINISSVYGSSAPRFEIYEGTNMTMPVEYAAIKGGVNSLTRYLGSYLGKYNIRVNSISPGGIFDNQPKEFVKKYTNFVKLEKRMANVDDMSGILIFLLSDASKYITGQNITVDGGFTL